MKAPRTPELFKLISESTDRLVDEPPKGPDEAGYRLIKFAADTYDLGFTDGIRRAAKLGCIRALGAICGFHEEHPDRFDQGCGSGGARRTA